MLPLRRPLHLPLAVRALLAIGGLAAAGLMRSKSWSQTLSIWALGTLQQNQRRSRMPCGGVVPTSVDEGIEAHVPFIPLASEPTS
jgi:hypothetical protein